MFVGVAGGGLVAIAFVPSWSAPLRLFVGVSGCSALSFAALAAVLALRPALVAFGASQLVATVTAFAALVTTVEDTVVDALARDAGHVVVTEYGLDFDEDAEVAARLERLGGVRSIVPFVDVALSVVVVDGAGEAAGPALAAIGRGLGRPHVGSPPRQLAVRPADRGQPPQVVLAEGLARRLGAQVGSRLRLAVPAPAGDGRGLGRPRMAEVVVAGFDRTGIAALDDRGLWMDLSAAQVVAFGERRVSGLAIHLDEPDRAPAFAAAAANLLPARFRVVPYQEAFAGFHAELAVFRAVGVAVGGMLLLAAAGLAGAALRLSALHFFRSLARLEVLGLDPAAGRVLWSAYVLAIALAGAAAGIVCAAGYAAVAAKAAMGQVVGVVADLPLPGPGVLLGSAGTPVAVLVALALAGALFVARRRGGGGFRVDPRP